MLRTRSALAAGLALLIAVPAVSQEVPQPEYGPVFADFGPHYPIEGVDRFPAHTQLSVAFDVSASADGEARNRGFENAARFINMNAANGVDPGDMRIAIVVHGAALRDLLTDAARDARDYGATNPSGAMVREMLEHGVRFIACGQSAVGSGIAREDLIPGVEMALSAMTAHALLQQQGYTENPF